MRIEPAQEPEILYGCPECKEKTMELQKQVDGSTLLVCRACQHAQRRGMITDLFGRGLWANVD